MRLNSWIPNLFLSGWTALASAFYAVLISSVVASRETPKTSYWLSMAEFIMMQYAIHQTVYSLLRVASIVSGI
jgi:hypothetical protein